MVANPLNSQEFDVELKVAEWRTYLVRHAALNEYDIDELESHLRDEMDALQEQGLKDDEAFLIAAKRVGDLDDVTREYAEVHSGRLWQNLVLSNAPGNFFGGDLVTVLLLAVGAGIAIKLPALFGLHFDAEGVDWFYARNITLFCLPFLALYFVLQRQLGTSGLLFVSITTAVAAAFINGYANFASDTTMTLAMMHLPIAIWFMVGVAYSGDWWRSHAKRMDFIRFSGEFLIYYVLMAIGGGVLTVFTLGMFNFIGIDIEWAVQSWIIPCGAMGAVVVAGWLVEAKQGAIENMAPVLARVFTPLFTLMLSVFLVTMLATGRGFDMQREVLIGLDLMLVVVLGLVLYAVSSRDPNKPVSLFDKLQLLLVVAALLVDVLALIAIAGRIFEMGFTANRVAALGENLILLVSLSGYAWHYWRFASGTTGFTNLEWWQTNYIPVYVGWAIVVAITFPLIF
ncbi:permease prefix domain 1-containing protein [Pseudidiomarina sp. E22-M8]|uniref:permease prefix domain 1-containing protein n=1 Tax=Pseudidiomarina sp. E22-M8 TaxID=3424768 RepID=UPI00403CCF5B